MLYSPRHHNNCLIKIYEKNTVSPCQRPCGQTKVLPLFVPKTRCILYRGSTTSIPCRPEVRDLSFEGSFTARVRNCQEFTPTYNLYTDNKLRQISALTRSTDKIDKTTLEDNTRKYAVSSSNLFFTKLKSWPR